MGLRGKVGFWVGFRVGCEKFRRWDWLKAVRREGWKAGSVGMGLRCRDWRSGLGGDGIGSWEWVIKEGSVGR